MKRFFLLTSAALVFSASALSASAAFIAGSIVINNQPAQAYPARFEGE